MFIKPKHKPELSCGQKTERQIYLSEIHIVTKKYPDTNDGNEFLFLFSQKCPDFQGSQHFEWLPKDYKVATV